MNNGSGIEIHWLTWEKAGEEILDLRRRVFMAELGWGEHRVHHDRDPEGLHLCAMSGGKIVAAISAYVYRPGAPEPVALGLPEPGGLTVEIGKRVALTTHRGRLISTRIANSMVRQLCEALRPSRFFLIVRPSQYDQLLARYAKRDFVVRGEVGSGDDAVTVMTVEGAEALEEFYLKHRELTWEPRSGDDEMSIPSLARFLVEGGRGDLLAVERLGAENFYLDLLSLRDEAPRLTAQGRLVLAEQRARLAATPFPPAPASLLDVGSGPGDYLAAVAGEDPFAGYAVRGVEPAAGLLDRARSHYPGLTFGRGSAYATGEADASHDVVTAHFVFVHLRSPDLALLEMRRVLRPGGLLYVVDVNDATFRGPGVIRRMLETYDRNYAGDRTVLSDLPGRAAEFGFQPVGRFATTLRHAVGAEPGFGPDEIRLGRDDAWNLLAFVRSQNGIEESFREAQDHYFGVECEIGVDIETQVYRLGPW